MICQGKCSRMLLGQWQWVVGRRIIRKRWLREKSRSFTRRDVKDHFVWHDQLLLSKTSGHLRLMEYFFFVKMLRGLTDIFFFSHTTAFQTSRPYSQVIFGQNIKQISEEETGDSFVLS